ncbi:MAG: type VI secretion system-associated protein TagO [Gammaproteobacteria bacterium]|nr:type VI secretion system-associated protein TagO [Gammaproteobacteria bacterium]
MKILIMLFISIVSNNVSAHMADSLAKCATEASDKVRLICYDSLVTKIGMKKPKTKMISGPGKWNVHEEKSQIDDSLNVHLFVISNETVSSGYNTVKPSLHIRCSENKTSVFLNWGLYLGLEKTKMLSRFDKEKATVSSWSISTNNEAVFVRGSDIEFAKKIMKHQKLLVKVTPFGENSVMATFDISGLSEAIKPLREACHW